MNNKGFSLIESLVAVTLLFMMVVTLIPLTGLIMLERNVFHEERLYSNLLHDKLQKYIWEHHQALPDQFEENYNGANLSFTFTAENQLVKGCVQWENAKHQPEELCFYGRAVK